MESSQRHPETTDPMNLESCRKFLLVVRDFPPGCGSAAKQPTVIGSGGTKQGAGVGKVPQQVNRDRARAVLENRKNTAGSGMVRNVVPSLSKMDRSKGPQPGSLGGKGLGASCCHVRHGPRPSEQVQAASSSQGGGDSARDKVQECLRLFRDICKQQAKENKALLKEGKEAVRRLDLHAYNLLKQQRKLVNANGQRLGTVPGVDIGDTFYYRMELYVVGLHHQTQNGIDCTTYKGETVATSVVASRSGSDDLSNPNELVYVGEGGSRTRDKFEDQQLTGGNLGLKNSIRAKTPVRVIRKVPATCRDMELVTSVPEVFIYDGLYTVEKLEEEWPFGSKVYKFTLKRIEGT